jgi:5,10-methylenetetrahydromethanopterin reductase
MEYAVDTTVNRNAVAVARKAESLGFDSIWFADSPVVAGDVFVGLGAVAAATDRIRIGPGVCVPWARNPVVTASAFGALNALAPGRVEMTFGTGFSARRGLGLPPMKYTDFSEHVRTVLELLDGKEVDVATDGGIKRVRLLHPDALNLEDVMEVFIAGSGPRIQGFAADIRANILDHPTLLALGFAGWMSSIESTWTRVTGSPTGLRVSLTMSVIVLRDGETLESPRVRAIAAPLAMNPVHYWTDELLVRHKQLPESLPEVVRDAVQKYVALIQSRKESSALHTEIHKGHALFVRTDASDILTSELMAQVCIIGKTDSVREQVESLAALGVRRIVIPVIPGYEDSMEELAQCFELPKR